MEQDLCDITAHFTTKERSEFRAVVVDGILHTDMRFHNATCSKLAELSTKQEADAGLSDEARGMLRESVIHFADLGGFTLKPELSLQWSDCVIREFQAEAVALERQGLDVPAFMQNQEKKEVANKGQVFFIENVLMPMWIPLSKILPELNPCVENLAKNCESFRAPPSKQ
jgi:hypothetical protein